MDREWIISCRNCGKSYYSSVFRCDVCNNILQTPIVKASIPVRTRLYEHRGRREQDLEKAGFMIRALAYIMDQILVALTLIILGLVGYLSIEFGAYWVSITPEELHLIFTPLIGVFCLVTQGIYYTFYHGYYGQTLGKMLLGLKVIKTNGEELSYSISLKRWFGYFASGFFFGIGYLMPIFTQNRQALHDKIADTFVIRI